MIDNIIFYGRTQVGLVVLLYLLAKKKRISVVPEDEIIEKVASVFKLRKIHLEDIEKENFDIFVCCHGKKILPERFLKKNRFINIHPCLFKYKGHDPIRKYMENKDTYASVESHYMTKDVDQGEVIQSVFFSTPIINSYEQFYNIAIPYYLECIHKTLEKIDNL